MITEGAEITVSTLGLGNAGNLTIKADSVNIQGNNEFPVGLFAVSLGEGNAGNIDLKAKTIRLDAGGSISVSGLGETSVAGDLMLEAGEILRTNGSTVSAETTAGSQGNISLKAGSLQLRSNSQITTNADGEATGGDIEMSTNTLSAFENSDITVNAEQGSAGNIQISAQGIFIDGEIFDADTPSPLSSSGIFLGTPNSDIIANSKFGSQGEVEIVNPNVDPANSLVILEAEVIQVGDLIASTCSATRKESSFVIIGRSGIPETPYNLQSPDTTCTDLRQLTLEVNQPTLPEQRSKQVTTHHPLWIRIQGFPELLGENSVCVGFPVEAGSRQDW